MSFRFMRTILFFDLPRETSKETRAAARFVKDIKKEGFIMLQESVYCKLMLNMSAFDALRKRLYKIKLLLQFYIPLNCDLLGKNYPHRKVYNLLI